MKEIHFHVYKDLCFCIIFITTNNEVYVLVKVNVIHLQMICLEIINNFENLKCIFILILK